MKSKKVSVIMACYNSENTLRDAIDSILAQTYQDWVMVCCDDGSQDNTWEILQEYKKKYPEKFVLLRNDRNRKLPYSLNKCIKHTRTELVARMDADDWSSPARLQKQVAALEEHPGFDLVGTGITVSDGTKKLGAIIQPEFPQYKDMLHCNVFSHATIMTYKRVYDTLGGYSLDPKVVRVEDKDLWSRFFKAGFKGFNLQEELYIVREDETAVQRRTLRARLNGAGVGYRIYRDNGISPVRSFIKAYKSVPAVFIPLPIYKKIHFRKIKQRTERNQRLNKGESS